MGQLRLDLDLALATVAETNRVIAATDVKAGFLLAAQGVVLAAGTTALTSGGGSVGAAGAVALAAVAAIVLLVVLWPRLTTTAASSWFGFPSVASLREPLPERPGPDELADQAWRQARVLAVIARRKCRWLRAGLVLAVASLLALASVTALALVP